MSKNKKTISANYHHHHRTTSLGVNRKTSPWEFPPQKHNTSCMEVGKGKKDYKSICGCTKACEWSDRFSMHFVL